MAIAKGSLIPEGTLRDSKPDYRDLESKIVDYCGAFWDKLGLKLGLAKHDIDNISMDHAYHPERSVACCRRMLAQWLRQSSSATWGKLEDAINEVKEDKKIDKDRVWQLNFDEQVHFRTRQQDSIPEWKQQLLERRKQRLTPSPKPRQIENASAVNKNVPKFMKEFKSMRNSKS